MTYERPLVTRYGTFRDLTLQGFTGSNDGLTFAGANGNNCQRYEIHGAFTTLTCIVGGGSMQQ